MTYSTRPAHLLAITALGAALAFGSAALADDRSKPTLMACNDRLPEGVSYRLEITSEMDTREGDPQGQLSVSLRDDLKPDSVEIPEGSGAYVRCVMDLLGVPDEELPEGA